MADKRFRSNIRMPSFSKSMLYHTFDAERYESWVKISIGWMGKVDDGFFHRLQRLGIADSEVYPICSSDLMGRDETEIEDPSGLFRAEIAMMRAELSLFQMYECVRVVKGYFEKSEKQYEDYETTLGPALKSCHEILRRIRIPLAKCEPARGFPSDALPVYGCSSTEGIGWKIGEEMISYRHISDESITLLSLIRSFRLRNSIMNT